MQSILLTAIRNITSILEFISPKLALSWTSKLFFSPRLSKKARIPDIPYLQQSWLSYQKITGVVDKCKVYTAGNGPVVLLVHGWEGSTSNLSTLAKSLLAADLKVVLFDLPAHGFSPGKKTNLLEISHIIKKLAETEGGDGYFKAIIAHSFGAACAGHAIKKGVKTDHFISISSPTNMDFIFDQFCSTIGASNKTKKGLIKQIEAILQGSYKEVSLIRLVAYFNKKGIKGIIAHDVKDRLIPYAQAKELSTAWPEAQLITTKGYGHNRILINKEVIQAIRTLLV